MSMTEKEVTQKLAEILGLKPPPLKAEKHVNEAMAEEINRLTKECWAIFDKMTIEKQKRTDIIFCTCLTIMTDILNANDVSEARLPLLVASFQIRMKKFFYSEMYEADDNTPKS